MDNILELLKSIPIVGWVIGGVVVLIGVKLVSKKGIGGNSTGISLDGILGNLRNNRKRTERTIDNNRVATESVDNAEDTIDRAEERVVESENVNDSAISAVESLTDGTGDSEDELNRAESIIDRVRSRKSAD